MALSYAEDLVSNHLARTFGRHGYTCSYEPGVNPKQAGRKADILFVKEFGEIRIGILIEVVNTSKIGHASRIFLPDVQGFVMGEYGLSKVIPLVLVIRATSGAVREADDWEHGGNDRIVYASTRAEQSTLARELLGTVDSLFDEIDIVAGETVALGEQAVSWADVGDPQLALAPVAWKTMMDHLTPLEVARAIRFGKKGKDASRLGTIFFTDLGVEIQKHNRMCWSVPRSGRTKLLSKWTDKVFGLAGVSK